MTTPSLTMLSALEAGCHHPDPTMRQYARNFEAICAWRGLGPAELAKEPADLATYLGFAPKYDKRDAKLARELIWSAGTYKQYQRGGRLWIEHLTGTLAARRARKAVINDLWADLRGRAASLARAKLVSERRLASLARIEDLAREEGFRPPELTSERVVALRARAHSDKDWTAVKKGAALLDDLRTFPTLLDVLPACPIGRIDATWRRSFTVPAHLEQALSPWLKRATTIYPDEVESEFLREALAERHSAGSQGVFGAAHRNYLSTLGEEKDITRVNSLAGCFGEQDALRVLQRWIGGSEQPGGLSPRSMAEYFECIQLGLERNGCPEEARAFSVLLRNHAVLRQGRAMSKRMSPNVETWCRDLLADAEKLRVFETQHVIYVRHAKAALDEAAAAELDLVELAGDETRLAKLPRKRRALAKRLLRRARMFGVAAAFAALELEGVPLRESNVLKLTLSGPRATFFNHSAGEDPHFRIVIPNALLKNGKFLTERNQELPPIFIRRLERDDVGVDILKFYLKRIRPLFPRGRTSNRLFPGIKGKTAHLDPRTWSNWLLECSIEAGLRITSHNFRHGHCSIQINEDPNSIEELAISLGDKPETLRKFYAFLDRERLLTTLQRKVAQRRAQYRAGRGLAGTLA